MLYDIFISHASEDKNEFVRPLVQILKDNHIEVWYDEFTLKPGDSIRRSIDIGLAKSRYGIVVLSKAFFKKGWTQWELDGLIQRLNKSKNNIIIPIWHNIFLDDVLEYSPSLADRVAIVSSNGLDYVVSEIKKIVKPEGSTLLLARDILIGYGIEPPVITDDWWLDVVEFSGSDYTEQGWGFPTKDKFPKLFSRSQKIAWAAMQMTWQQKREIKKISHISKPEVVLNFIRESPGLEEVCHLYPRYLAVNAPQLTIRGFGGQFEEDFEKLYIESQKDFQEYYKEETHDEEYEYRITIGCTGKPICESLYALRHPEFGNWKATEICRVYMGGNLFADVLIYSAMDYLLWLISDESAWLPERIHKYLLEGVKFSKNWVWYEPIDFFHTKEIVVRTKHLAENLLIHCEKQNVITIL